MTKDKYLERSHYEYPRRFILSLLVATVIFSVLAVGATCFVSDSTGEIVNGLPFATDIPGLGSKADASQWEERSRQGFIGYVRLVPVRDHPTAETKVPSGVYSLGREDQDGSVLPKFYYPVFSESDLMRRLRSIGGIIYTRLYYSYAHVRYER